MMRFVDCRPTSSKGPSRPARTYIVQCTLRPLLVRYVPGPCNSPYGYLLPGTPCAAGRRRNMAPHLPSSHQTHYDPSHTAKAPRPRPRLRNRKALTITQCVFACVSILASSPSPNEHTVHRQGSPAHISTGSPPRRHRLHFPRNTSLLPDRSVNLDLLTLSSAASSC